MLRFKRKMILSHLIGLTCTLGVIYPLIQWSVNKISALNLDKPLTRRLQEATDLKKINKIMKEKVRQVKRDFTIGILILAGITLLLVSLFDLILIHYITLPIHWIIDAIRPYQEGKVEFLPKIRLKEAPQSNEFVRLANTLNSLTDQIQKQIESLKLQRKETEEILESIGEGIIATDTSGRISFMNKVAYQMLGIGQEVPKKEALNHLKVEFFDLAQSCHEMIVYALQTSKMRTEYWKGAQFLQLTATLLAHKGGALLVLQDKSSDLKVVEMGKDFIANASHELRTPITIIRGFAETLQDLPNLSAEMLKEITEKITRTCTRLEKLMQSLLTLMDVENLSPDRLKMTDLVLLADNCKHLLKVTHPEVQIKIFAPSDPVLIKADPYLIELAITNLLENGIRYSQGAPSIELEIHPKKNEAEIVVKDQGIGISEKDIPHIFERFYTVDKARSRKFGGAGLGLSIVKTIAEKHRGSVEVASNVGSGSVFKILFPLVND